MKFLKLMRFFLVHSWRDMARNRSRTAREEGVR